MDEGNISGTARQQGRRSLSPCQLLRTLSFVDLCHAQSNSHFYGGSWGDLGQGCQAPKGCHRRRGTLRSNLRHFEGPAPSAVFPPPVPSRKKSWKSRPRGSSWARPGRQGRASGCWAEWDTEGVRERVRSHLNERLLLGLPCLTQTRPPPGKCQGAGLKTQRGQRQSRGKKEVGDTARSLGSPSISKASA